MVLDACRNNPFARSFRSASRGLAKMHAPKGSVILYATSPGDVAADGSGKNGLFTENLMQSMNKKGLKIEEVFKQTAIAVSRESNEKQVPYFEGVILGDFYFNGKVTVNQAPIELASADPDMASKDENIFWDSVKNSNDIEMYQAYLNQFKKGKYAILAKIKLKRLAKQNKSEPKPVSTHAKLTIRSNVNNDKVKINGEDKGSIRLDILLKSGIYELEISKEGYSTWERSLQINASNDQTVYAKLKKTAKPRPVQTTSYSRPKVKTKKSIYSQPKSPIKQSTSTPKTITDRATGMELVKIPSGCFQMGSNEQKVEKPIHRVCITEDYYLGKYEVTQGQWQEIMENNPSRFKKGDNHPVEKISWNDVQKFIRKLNSRTGKNYRLPTEAEWEYACRSGGKKQKFCGGNNASTYAWFDETLERNWKNGHHSVGGKTPNGLGLYDMTGIVLKGV